MAGGNAGSVRSSQFTEVVQNPQSPSKTSVAWLRLSALDGVTTSSYACARGDLRSKNRQAEFASLNPAIRKIIAFVYYFVHFVAITRN